MPLLQSLAVLRPAGTSDSASSTHVRSGLALLHNKARLLPSQQVLARTTSAPVSMGSGSCIDQYTIGACAMSL